MWNFSYLASHKQVKWPKAEVVGWVKISQDPAQALFPSLIHFTIMDTAQGHLFLNHLPTTCNLEIRIS